MKNKALVFTPESMNKEKLKGNFKVCMKKDLNMRI
jgi:hypothetical protein